MSDPVKIKKFAQSHEEGTDPEEIQTNLLSDQEREKLSERYSLSYLKVLDAAVAELKETQPKVAKHRSRARQHGEHAVRALELMHSGFLNAKDETRAVFLGGEKPTREGEQQVDKKVLSRFEKWKQSVTILIGTWTKLLDTTDHQIDICTKVLVKLKLPQFRMPAALEAFFTNSTKEVVEEHRFKRLQEARDIFTQTKMPLNETQKNLLADSMKNAAYAAAGVSNINHLFRQNQKVDPFSKALEHNAAFGKRVQGIVIDMLLDFKSNRIIHDGKLPSYLQDAALKQLRKACQEFRINASLDVLEAYIEFAAGKSRGLSEEMLKELRTPQSERKSSLINLDQFKSLIRFAQDAAKGVVPQTPSRFLELLEKLENQLPTLVQTEVSKRLTVLDPIVTELVAAMQEEEFADGNNDLDQLVAALEVNQPNANTVKTHIENLKKYVSNEEPNAPKLPAPLDNKTIQACKLLIASLTQYSSEVSELIELLRSTYDQPQVLPSLTTLGQAWMDQTAGNEKKHIWVTREGDGEAVLALFDKDTGLIKQSLKILSDFKTATDQERVEITHEVSEVTNIRFGTEIAGTPTPAEDAKPQITVQDVRNKTVQEVAQTLTDTNLGDQLILISQLTHAQQKEINHVSYEGAANDPELKMLVQALMEKASDGINLMPKVQEVVGSFNGSKKEIQDKNRKPILNMLMQTSAKLRDNIEQIKQLALQIADRDAEYGVTAENVSRDAALVYQVVATMMQQIEGGTAKTEVEEKAVAEEATEHLPVRFPDVSKADLEGVKQGIANASQQFTSLKIPNDITVKMFVSNAQSQFSSLTAAISKIIIFTEVVERLSTVSARTRDMKEMVTRFVSSQNQMKQVETDLDNVLSEATALGKLFGESEPFVSTDDLYDDWYYTPVFIQKVVDRIRELAKPLHTQLAKALQRVHQVYDTYLVNNRGRFTDESAKIVSSLLNSLSTLIATAQGFQGVTDEQYHVAFYKLLQKRIPEIIESVSTLQQLQQGNKLYKTPKSPEVASSNRRTIVAQPAIVDEEPEEEDLVATPKTKEKKLRDRKPIKLLELLTSLKSSVRTLIEANDEQVDSVFNSITRTLKQLQSKTPYGHFGIADADNDKREEEMRKFIEHKKQDSSGESLGEDEVDSKLDETLTLLEPKYRAMGLQYDSKIIDANSDIIEQIIANKPQATADQIADLYIKSINHRIQTMQGFGSSELKKKIKHYREQEGSGAKELARQLETLFSPSNKEGRKKLYQFVEENLHDYNTNLLETLIKQLTGPEVQRIASSGKSSAASLSIDESRLNRLMALCLNTESK